MKVKTLSALAGIGGAMILSGSANAAYTGLTIELAQNGIIAGGAPRDVYRVYANFNSPSDVLTAVYGNVASPMNISLNGATAFNPPSGGNVPQNASGVTYAPASEWDSYATIGLAAGYAGSSGANLVLSPGFPTFITSAGIVNNTNIAWATAGPLAQGSPIAGRVLIMQLSVNDNGAAPTGSVGINYLAGGTVVTQVNNQTFAIPAPGAIALLGLAGLVGRRRRTA